jgi:hypothetical protein
MGVPTSEVGDTSATTRRGTTKSMTDMWWHWGGGIYIYMYMLVSYRVYQVVWCRFVFGRSLFQIFAGQFASLLEVIVVLLRPPG